MINTTSLWTEVIWHKYIAHVSVSNWIRDPERKEVGILVVWKVILNSFDVMWHNLAWKVGNGRSVHISIDP